jgi:hypothetical protein
VPFSAEVAAVTTPDDIVGLETEGTYLTAVDATSSTLLLYDPTTFAAPTTKSLTIVGSGGDIAPDTATGSSTVSGTTSLSAVQGMFSQNNFTRYYVTDSDLDAIIPIDIVTASLGSPIPLCHPCPGTAYDLLTGDAAATTP